MTPCPSFEPRHGIITPRRGIIVSALEGFKSDASWGRKEKEAEEMKKWQKGKLEALLKMLPKERVLEALDHAEKTNNEYKEKYWTLEEFKEARKMVGGR